MEKDRLNSLTMLSMEKDMTARIPDFNTRVIEIFANKKKQQNGLDRSKISKASVLFSKFLCINKYFCFT